jgi:pimeloyl-[acyl-carrier protein] methyl ester esterase
LLMIHGWGMHGGMWGDAAGRLAQDFRVLMVDLPGHGLSGNSGVGSRKSEVEKGNGFFCSPLPTPHSPIDDIVDQLSAQFSEPLTLCGWSLGGQVALCWALREPEKVRRLILVASTPCFVRRPDWACAMAAETLMQFSVALQQDYAQTLRRFLALQVRGSENERVLLAGLREALFDRGEPDMGALQSGLEILRDCDLRGALPEVKQPVLVIAGERDTLTPLQAAQYMAAQMPDARLITIKGAAHAPFLSRPEIFVERIREFLKSE